MLITLKSGCKTTKILYREKSNFISDSRIYKLQIIKKKKDNIKGSSYTLSFY